MRIGYARVSTIEQDTKLQTDALKKVKCDRIITEKASGAKIDRPELMRVVDIARKGDVLIVWKLDRLARSVRQLIETVQLLDDKGVQLRSLTENIDTSTAGGKLVFHVFAALAEFERGVIRERTLAGLAAARSDGRNGGRPPALSTDDVELAQTLLAKGETMEKLMDRFGVTRSTLYKYGLRRHPPVTQKPKPRGRKQKKTIAS
jgi:DNA invertase Pin-like site-specific DNA recombinase